MYDPTGEHLASRLRGMRLGGAAIGRDSATKDGRRVMVAAVSAWDPSNEARRFEARAVGGARAIAIPPDGAG